MPVRHEIKSQLAKLLATEDLVVEHKKCETAQFNVHTRVLTLPMWEKASNTVYDLLVGHEVGHALYTPDEDWLEKRKIPPQFVNVVEDVRIEKLMKRRYAGLAKTFFAGYKELSEQDFFSLENEDVGKMNLADRANLQFKIGNFIDISIERGEETEIINMIADTETFADVLDAAEVLYKYCKQSKEQEKIDDIESQSQSESGNSGSSSDFTNQQEGENNLTESTEGEDQSSSDKTGEVEPKPSNLGGEKNEPEVKTVESLEDAIKDLVNNDGHENVYLEIPKVDLNRVIVSNLEIHSKCKETWDELSERTNQSKEVIFKPVDKKYIEFKRSAQKEVNYLVKEFECRKAADSYARASTSKTGVLDCSKLHSYKYTEDIFKKVTTLADGKNHGLIFVLDWSGSMGEVILDTIKQLYNLIWFCKKVSIPFEVYAFTSDYPLVSYDANGRATIRQLSYTKKQGLINVWEGFSMMNLLTSKVSGKTLEDQLKNIFRIAYSFRYYGGYSIPLGMSLSGTPLNEALISLHQILPKFQKENKLQKVQCVVLTDGEAHHLKYHKEVNRGWQDQDEIFIGLSGIYPGCFLRDRKTGNTYSLDGAHTRFTDTLLFNLRDNFPNINFIGIRVLESRDSGHFIRNYCGYYGNQYDRVMSSWKKEKAFSIKTSGYHTYFGLSSSTLSQDSEFAVSEDASKSQIKNAFAKSLKSKKMNKKVLGEFIQLVA